MSSEVFPPEIGGSGELLRNVYARLRGHQITVLTDGPADGTTTEALEDGMRVIRTPRRDWRLGLLNPTGLGHHLRQAARLRKLPTSSRTLIHCGRALPEGIDALLGRTVGGPRYLCWAHGEELSAVMTSRELTILIKPVLRFADAFIANSKNTAEILARTGAPPNRIHLVYPGVDAARFRPDIPGAEDIRRRLLLPGEMMLLTVARLQRRKGHDLVLQALAGLAADTPPVRYAIVGDGPERPALERLAAELGLADRVLFLGVVPERALPAYYAAADLFVHPNRIDGSDFEGFGMVFLEASAAGVPVIGGDSGGVPEAVERDVSGLLVSGTSAAELRDGIAGLLRSSERRKAMGTSGRRRALADFSWERAAEQVRSIHEEIIERHPGSS